MLLINTSGVQILKAVMLYRLSFVILQYYDDGNETQIVFIVIFS